MMTSIIIQSQQGDSDATMALIKQFRYSLKKYAFKLRYEDAYYDLCADFIELIKNIRMDRISEVSGGSERAVIAYIYAAIHNSYIKKLINLKRRQRYEVLSYEAISESEKYHVEAVSAAYDSHAILELTGLVHVLTKKELLVIKMLFLFQYSVPEIASAWGVSKQAVLCTRNRALKKIKKWLALEQVV